MAEVLFWGVVSVITCGSLAGIASLLFDGWVAMRRRPLRSEGTTLGPTHMGRRSL